MMVKVQTHINKLLFETGPCFTQSINKVKRVLYLCFKIKQSKQCFIPIFGKKSNISLKTVLVNK